MQIFDSSYKSKAYIANLFYNEVKNNSYIVIGGKSEWAGGIVPMNSPSLSIIPEAFLYIYAHKVSLVKVNLNGELSVESRNFIEYSDSEIDINHPIQPNAIYFKAFVSSEALNSLPNDITDYRIMGLYHNVVESPSVVADKQEGSYFSTNTISFILDKAFNYEAININTLSDQNIQIVKTF